MVMQPFKLTFGVWGHRTYLTAESIATGVTITWGRSAIHKKPEKRTLSATVVVDSDQAATLRALPYQPIRAELGSTVLFSGVITAAKITAGGDGKPFTVSLQAVAIPNELNGKFLKSYENFYTLNSSTTTKNLLDEVKHNYNLHQTWQVQLPNLRLATWQRVQVFDSHDAGVPSWTAFDAMEVSLAQHPLYYPTHTPDFRTWLLCNDLNPRRKVIAVDGATIGGTTEITFSTAEVPTSINPFGGGFYVGSDDIRQNGRQTPEFWVYPARAMFGNHAPADDDLRFAQPTTPDYNGLNIFSDNHICQDVTDHLVKLYSLQATPPRVFTFDSTLDPTLPSTTWNTWEQAVDYYVSNDLAATMYSATPIYRAIGGRLTVTSKGLRHELTMIYANPQGYIPAGARWIDVDPTTQWRHLYDSQTDQPYSWSNL